MIANLSKVKRNMTNNEVKMICYTSLLNIYMLVIIKFSQVFISKCLMIPILSTLC